MFFEFGGDCCLGFFEEEGFELLGSRWTGFAFWELSFSLGGDWPPDLWLLCRSRALDLGVALFWSLNKGDLDLLSFSRSWATGLMMGFLDLGFGSAFRGYCLSSLLGFSCGKLMNSMNSS